MVWGDPPYQLSTCVSTFLIQRVILSAVEITVAAEKS